MEWFYAFNGRQAGPVSEAELGELARTGVVLPETLVWKAGMGDWQAYSSVAPPPPPPVMPPPVPEAAPYANEDMRFCTSCGNRFPVSELAVFGDSAVCAICKPAYVQRLAQGMTSTTPLVFEYAGFWIRALAYFIDGLILAVIRYAITIPLGLEGFFRPLRPGLFYSFLGAAALIGYALQGAYYVYFWTQHGATPGKMALGLKVIRPDGGGDFGRPGDRAIFFVFSRELSYTGHRLYDGRLGRPKARPARPHLRYAGNPDPLKWRSPARSAASS